VIAPYPYWLAYASVHTHRAAVAHCFACSICSVEDSSSEACRRILVVLVQRGPTKEPPGVKNDGLEIPPPRPWMPLSSRAAAFTTSERVFTIRLANNILSSRTINNPTPSRPAGPVPAPAAGFKQAAAGQPAMVPGWIDPGQANHGSATPHSCYFDDDVYSQRHTIAVRGADKRHRTSAAMFAVSSPAPGPRAL
jgi:hypothetical protein